MVRKFVMAVLFTLGGLPLSVYGIGLGEMKTHSGLNQNFKGEIRLLSVPRGELDTMRVKLASREAFAKVGSEYAPVLSRLRFELVRRKNGSAVILVTSRSVIREPFLDFLVEVNWPNGRLVKEYTVLLDPPATTKRRPAEISKPKISAKKKVTTSTTAPVKRASTQPRAQTLPGSSDLYGPVTGSETAWKIAAELRPEGVSIHQMLMALLYVNPQAFVNNNVNMLKKGSMLRVPSFEEIKALDGQDAVASFERQTDDWQENVTGTAAAPATVGSTPDADAAVPQAESQQVEVEEDSGRLQIAAASLKGDGEAGVGETEGAPGDGEEDLRHELMLARENMETARLQTEEYKATVGDMEGQLQEMKRLLTLQDKQLAYLRARVSSLAEEDPTLTADDAEDALLAETQAETDATPDQETGETAEIDETAETDGISEPGYSEDAAVAGTEAEVIAGAEEPMELETGTAAGDSVELETETAAEDSMELETHTAAEDPVELETGIAAVEPATSNAAKSPVGSETSTEAESPMEEVADNSLQTSWLEDNLSMIAATAGGLFGVGVLTALVRGRKKQPETEEIAGVHENILPYSRDHKTGTGSQSEVEQEDLPSNSEYFGMDVPAFGQDATEVDTLAAVDVYVAYSRYDQAQKTLEEEIESGDKSVPIRHKLLEVYSATDNVQSFFDLADSMVKDGQDKEDTQAWEHIREMGKKLDKFNPLFCSADSAPISMEESELSLGLDSVDKEQDDTESLGGLESLDLDLAPIGLQGDSESDEGNLEIEIAAVETELDTELADLSMLDDVTQTKAAESTGESDEEIRFAEPLQDLELGDDMDTKLDLARAYMEMGDDEAAASILREVLDTGSAEQMASASELLSRLNS